MTISTLVATIAAGVFAGASTYVSVEGFAFMSVRS